MRRVTFTRGYRMYQPGETAGFSDSEAGKLIPAYGYDADGPTPEEVKKAEAAAAAKAAEEAEKAKAAEEAEKAKAAEKARGPTTGAPGAGKEKG